MADKYTARFTMKDASAAKTKTFTLSNVDPKVYNKLQGSSADAQQARSVVASFGIAYAAALNSDTTLSKAEVIKTSTESVFDVTF